MRATSRRPAAWPPWEREAIAAAAGRVLDVGCGAGRHALHLQARGLDVVAIDASPGAVEVWRARGVRDARVLSITAVGPRLGRFGTVLMLGNNFGLLGDARRAVRLLGTFGRLAGPDGCVVAESVDPYWTANPEHLAYHERNRQRGRMPGQLRIRVRHGAFATPWFDYLFVSPAEMSALARAAGWEIAQMHDGGGPHPGGGGGASPAARGATAGFRRSPWCR